MNNQATIEAVEAATQDNEMMESIEEREEEMEASSRPYRPGEKGVAFFWLIFGAFFFYLSLNIYREHPGLSGPGALPLGVTGLIIVCALACIVIDYGKASETKGIPLAQIIKKTFGIMFPANVIFTMVMMLAYCVCLNMGLGFYPTTALFLWMCMMFFMRGKYMTTGKCDKKALGQTITWNLLWTAVCLLFIFIVFSKLFSVVLP